MKTLFNLLILISVTFVTIGTSNARVIKSLEDLTLTPASGSNIIFNDASVTGSLPLKVGSSKELTSGLIDVASEITGILPVANGGSGSSSLNAVTLTGNQTVAGDKTFSGKLATLSTTIPSLPCPVMTEAQRDAIGSPVSGDCVFNSDDAALNVYATGAWGAIGSGGSMTDSEVKIAYENNADTNAFTDALVTLLGNQSGTNTGDEDLSALLVNPLTTTGDIIYSSSGTTAARLAIGSNGEVLTLAGGVPTWAASGGGGGSGDVVGPASATDNAIVRFDSTTGKLVQDSGVTIADTGSITGMNGSNLITDQPFYMDSTGNAAIGSNGTGNNFYIWNNGLKALNFSTTTISPELPISLNNGTVSAPSIAFNGMPDGGLYRDSGSDSLRMAINGVDKFIFDDTLIEAGTALTVSGTSSSAIQFNVTAAASQTANILEVEDSSGTNLLEVEDDGVLRNALRGDTTTFNLAAVGGSSNHGINLTGTGNSSQINVRAGNAALYSFTTSGLAISGAGTYAVRSGANGSVSAPAFTFDNDRTSGLYRSASDTMAISANGVLGITIHDDWVASSHVFGVGQYATGSLPAAATYEGHIAYDTTTNEIKFSDSSTWSTLGGAAAITDLDTFYRDDFSVNTAAGLFTVTGDAATPDNAGTGTMSGGFATRSGASAMNGIYDAGFLTNGAGTNDFFLSDTISVSDIAASQTATFTFHYEYNGADDDMSFIVLDSTNDTVISHATNHHLKLTSEPTRFYTTIDIPSTCTAIRYGFQRNAGTLKSLYFTDVTFRTPMLELFETKTLSADVTTTTDITDLTFTNLTIGRTYRLGGLLFLSTGTALEVQAYSAASGGGTNYGIVGYATNGNASAVGQGQGVNNTFVAVSTTVILRTINPFSQTLAGDGTNTESHITLTELVDVAETTKF